MVPYVKNAAKLGTKGLPHVFSTDAGWDNLHKTPIKCIPVLSSGHRLIIHFVSGCCEYLAKSRPLLKREIMKLKERLQLVQIGLMASLLVGIIHLHSCSDVLNELLFVGTMYLCLRDSCLLPCETGL